jgi:hypothetical protein
VPPKASCFLLFVQPTEYGHPALEACSNRPLVLNLVIGCLG